MTSEQIIPYLLIGAPWVRLHGICSTLRHTTNYILKYLNNYTYRHLNKAIIKLELTINTYILFFL